MSDSQRGNRNLALRREHRWDAIFAAVGLLLMWGILWVLAALFLRLLIDPRK